MSAIARIAGVDRTFLYRHRDLLAQIHASQQTPPAAGSGPAATRASLQADLLAAHERAARMAARILQLESRLSQALGEQAWRESGLGAPADIDELRHSNSQLEQQATDLRMQIEEREQDLAAARAANRELMTQLNATATSGPVTRRVALAPHPSCTVTSHQQPLSCTNMKIHLPYPHTGDPQGTIPTGKDAGLGHFPSFDFRGQRRVADRRDDRADLAGLAETAGAGRRPVLGRTQDAALPRAARRGPAGAAAGGGDA